MTPAEKADEMVRQMRFTKNFPQNTEWAKNCATVAVDEILIELGGLHELAPKRAFWTFVREEIGKIE